MKFTLKLALMVSGTALLNSQAHALTINSQLITQASATAAAAAIAPVGTAMPCNILFGHADAPADCVIPLPANLDAAVAEATAAGDLAQVLAVDGVGGQLADVGVGVGGAGPVGEAAAQAAVVNAAVAGEGEGSAGVLLPTTFATVVQPAVSTNTTTKCTATATATGA